MSEDQVPTALYRLFGDDDVLLYIGISDTFGRRWNQHAQSQSWWPEVRRQAVDWHPTRDDAEAAEEAAIKAEKPRYNIMHNPSRVPPVPRATKSAGIPPREAPRPPVLSLEDTDRFTLLAVMGGMPPRDYASLLTGEPTPSYATHLEFFRYCAKGAVIIDDALAAIWQLDLGGGAEAVTRAAPHLGALLSQMGLSCPYCDGSPGEAMTCRGCGTDGPLPGTPGSVVSQLPFTVRAITGVDMHSIGRPRNAVETGAAA